MKYYGDLVFDENFLFALDPDQNKIKFSKLERTLLQLFTRKPNVLLNRERLLLAVSNIGSDCTDRNIDYLVSRLRKKLGDSAKTPQYIATQYGEGYIWVAAAHNYPMDDRKAIYLSIGPIYGLARADLDVATTKSFIPDLTAALRKSFGERRRIESRPDVTKITKDEERQHQSSKYALELSFLNLRDSLACSIVAFNRRSGQVFGTFRLDVSKKCETTEWQRAVSKLADNIRNKIWETQIFRAGVPRSVSEEPLTVSLYKAAQLFEPEANSILTVEKSLRDRLDKNPDDHEAAVLLATNIFNQIFGGDFENQDAREREIEALIFNHLPYIQNDALYLSAAAERLYSLGHTELGENLAQRALDLGPSFAACYMVLGRIKVMQGCFDEGIAYYEHSMEMSEKDSVFFKLVYTMACVAYKAMDDMDKVRELLPYILSEEKNELHRMVLEIYFLSANTGWLRPEVVAVAKQMPIQSATHLLKILYFVGARLFVGEKHRKNILAGPVRFYVDIHGVDVVPNEILQSTPNVLDA